MALLTIGTRGDVAPYVALGRALERRNHRVTLATLGAHRRPVENGGMRFVSISDGLGDLLESDLARLYASPSLRDRLRLPFATQRLIARLSRELMEGCRTAIRDADLVIHHPLLIFAPDIARAYGAPAIMAAPQPVAATAAFPLCVLSARDLGRTLNRATYGLFALERLLLARKLRRFLRERVATDATANVAAPAAPPTRALFAYSPAIGPVGPEWGDDVAVTGVWTEPPARKWRLSSELEAFLAAGPPPIYVGFGSMPWNPERNRDLIVEAVRLWGGRAVVGRGWGGVATDRLPPTMLAVGNAPHARLFPRVAAVVHHGGAGTTASGLAAGRPSFVTPIVLDQFFWGARVHALGAGPAPVALARLDPGRLAAAVADLTTRAAYGDAAREIAARMAAEDGIARAVALVEQALGPPRADDAPTAPSPLAPAARSR